MDQTTLFAAIAIVLVVAILGVVATRGPRRERMLAPARLGPSWSPPAGEVGEDLPLASGEDRAERAAAIQQRTGLGRATVDTVLDAWDEYHAVLGLAALPADHSYRVYDPYVPPVAERGPTGQPLADPLRVARDVARRTPIAQSDAMAVLNALSQASDAGDGGAERT